MPLGSGSEHVSVATQAAGSRGRLLTILLRPLYADKIPDGKPANEFGYDEKMLDEVSFLLTTTVLYSSLPAS